MDSLQNYLADIYESTGISIKKGDPITALHGFLEHFEKDLKLLMDEQRQQMISALEQEQQKWQEQSRLRAERIIERGLNVAQEQACKVFDERAALLCQNFTEIFNSRIAEVKAVESKLSFVGKLNFICIVGLFVLLSVTLIFFL